MFEKAFKQPEYRVGGKPFGPNVNTQGHWYHHSDVKWDLQMSYADIGLVVRPTVDTFKPPQTHRFRDALDWELVEQLRKQYRGRDNKPIIGFARKSTAIRLGNVKTLSPDVFFKCFDEVGAKVKLLSLEYGKLDVGEEDIYRAMNVIVDSEAKPLEDLTRVFHQIAACDAIVCGSGTIVHMAGVIGVPTQLLVPMGRAWLWYWIKSLNYCPWYRSVSYARQKNSQTWRHAIQTAALALKLRFS
jgi:ADP-heptose:LPS heptosyltransferase